MQKWEYRTLYRGRNYRATGSSVVGKWSYYEGGTKIEGVESIGELLTSWGEQGWELVAVVPSTMGDAAVGLWGIATDEWIFKRPKPKA